MKTIITTICLLCVFILKVLPQYLDPCPNPPDANPTPNFVTDVYTPKGKSVHNFRSSNPDVATFTEMSQDNIDYYDSCCQSNYPLATYLASSTHKYNCHGYAWHYLENTGDYRYRWIGVSNPATVSAYWADENISYIEIGSSTGANEKVHYSTGYQDHSAVTTSTSSVFESKWGRGPLVRHAKTYCPYYQGHDINYYKINPDISGSRNKLCEDDRREYTQQSITHLSNINHSWDATGYLTEASGTASSIFWVEANSQIGTGQVELTVTTPSGNIGTRTITIDVNCQPDEEDVSVTIDEQGGGWVDEVCPYTNYYFYITNDDDNCSTSGYSWDLPSGWTEYYSSSNMIFANSGPSPEGLLEISATTVCGTYTVIYSEIIPESDDCGYYMVFSPNPTSGETILELTSCQPDYFKNDMEWQLEIYSQGQILKEKKTKLQNTRYCIQTSGWKEGIYYVHVNLNGLVKTGILVVAK